MKRSSGLKLLLMGSATLALGACDDTTDLTQGSVYDTVTQCQEDRSNAGQDCAGSLAEAERQHLATAPRYDSQQACEEEFGPGRCQTGPASEQAASGGGSFFMPLMAGFMIGRLLDGGSRGAYAQPLYRPYCPPGSAGGACAGSSGSGAGGRAGFGGYYTAAGRAVASAPGAVSVPRSAFTETTRSTTTVSRGGFGARAQSVGVSSGS